MDEEHLEPPPGFFDLEARYVAAIEEMENSDDPKRRLEASKHVIELGERYDAMVNADWRVSKANNRDQCDGSSDGV
jgi:hypothetical protein